MKKVFIGLLIAAAGTAVYFLTNNGSNPGKNSIQKDLIIGKWKLDSIYSLKDSVFNPIADSAGYLALHLGKYEYEFTTNGSIMLLPTDSSTIENRYE